MLELLREIRRLTRAVRQHGAARGLGWALAAALATTLLAALAARVAPLWHHDQVLWALALLLPASALAGLLLGYTWPRPLPQRLRLLDRRLGLADRLTTAWELIAARIHAPEAMLQLQYHQTLDVVRRVDPRHAFPARIPRTALIANLLLLLALMPALLLPNPQEAVLAQIEAQRAATEEALAQLEAAHERLAQHPALSEAEREAALRALEEAMAVLQDRGSTPEEQQAALAEAERALAELRQPEAEAQAQRLAEAAPLSTEAVVQPLAELLQRGEIEAAAEYLRALTDPTGEPLTAEEMLALADAFAQMAEQLQESDPELAEQLQQAAQEIYTGDIAEATEAIQQAADSLSEAGNAQEPNEALAEAQGNLQQAQEGLGAPQRSSGAPAGSPGGSAPSPGGATGQSDAEGTSQGAAGHSEDAGSGAPYGENSAPRLGEAGGEITLPREQVMGDDPQRTTGRPNDARVPYQEVYGTYREAAEADLSRNAYPPTLRSYVRTYFEGLESTVP